MAIDISALLTDIYPSLGCSTAANSVFWTEAELLRYSYDAAQRLARNTGGFLERVTGLTVTAGDVEVSLPVRTLALMHLSIAGVSLKAATEHQLDARNEEWRSEDGTPEWWAPGLGGDGKALLYPNPTATGTANALVQRFPAETTTITAPAALTEYFRFAILAAARGKESKGAMPEVADWLRQLTDMIEDISRSYWGAAQ